MSKVQNSIETLQPMELTPKIISFALVTRLLRTEIPYLNEFLSYYKHIGVDYFYLVSTEPEHSQEIINAVAKEYIDVVRLVDKNPKDNFNLCTNVALPMINETYLLHVDMDEFLYLNGQTLSEFIHSEALHEDNARNIECNFTWIMSPLCSELSAPSIQSILERKKFFHSTIKQSLMRTENIKTIRNHVFVPKTTKTQKQYDPIKTKYFIFHVSSRGMFDTINKIHYGKYETVKRSTNPKEDLLDLLYNTNSSSLPNRIILLAFQNKFSDHYIKINFKYPKLKYSTDLDVLNELTINGLKALFGKDIIDIDIRKVVLEKMDLYPIPKELVNEYAAGNITLLKALAAIEEAKT